MGLPEGGALWSAVALVDEASHDKVCLAHKHYIQAGAKTVRHPPARPHRADRYLHTSLSGDPRRRSPPPTLRASLTTTKRRAHRSLDLRLESPLADISCCSHTHSGSIGGGQFGWETKDIPALIVKHTTAAGLLARRAVEESGAEGVLVLGSLPCIWESHRPRQLVRKGPRLVSPAPNCCLSGHLKTWGSPSDLRWCAASEVWRLGEAPAFARPPQR